MTSPTQIPPTGWISRQRVQSCDVFLLSVDSEQEALTAAQDLRTVLKQDLGDLHGAVGIWVRRARGAFFIYLRMLV